MVDTQKTFQNTSFQLLFRCHLMHFDFFELKIKSLFILTEKIKKKNLLCINIRTKAPNFHSGSQQLKYIQGNVARYRIMQTRCQQNRKKKESDIKKTHRIDVLLIYQIYRRHWKINRSKNSSTHVAAPCYQYLTPKRDFPQSSKAAGSSVSSLQEKRWQQRLFRDVPHLVTRGAVHRPITRSSSLLRDTHAVSPPVQQHIESKQLIPDPVSVSCAFSVLVG